LTYFGTPAGACVPNGACASGFKTSSVVPSGVLLVNVVATDAYGNTIIAASVPAGAGDIQVALSTSAGSLSVTTANIYAVTQTKFDTQTSGYTIQLQAPASGTAVVAATGTTNGLSLTGSATVTVVSALPTLTLVTVPTTKTNGVPSTFSGTASASAGLYSNSIVSVTYSVNNGAITGTATGTTTSGVFSWTFTVVLPAGNDVIAITATDFYGNVATSTVQVPVIPVGSTFTIAPTPAPTTLGGFTVIGATITNNYYTTLTVFLFAVWYNAGGAQVLISPGGPTTLAAGATGPVDAGYIGLAHGTYSVQIWVESTTGIVYSATSTITVTV